MFRLVVSLGFAFLFSFSGLYASESLKGTAQYFENEILYDAKTPENGELVRDLERRIEEIVIVRIPKPGTSVSHTTSIQTLDEERSALIWKHIFQGDDSENWPLKLQVKDLYDLGDGRGLFIENEIPVIVDMVFMLEVESQAVAEYLNSDLSPVKLRLEFSEEQVFPDHQGPKRFRLEDKSLTHHSAMLVVVGEREVKREAARLMQDPGVTGLRTARGLSPLSDFRVKGTSKALQRLIAVFEEPEQEYPDQMTSLFVVMKIASANRGNSMTWMLNE